MLRYELATSLSLTVMLATLHFEYMQNLPAKFQAYMSGHSFAIAIKNMMECLATQKLATIFTHCLKLCHQPENHRRVHYFILFSILIISRHLFLTTIFAHFYAHQKNGKKIVKMSQPVVFDSWWGLNQQRSPSITMP